MIKEDVLPEGWGNRKLLDLCDIKTGKVDANHHSNDGIYPFFTCALEPLKSKTYSFDDELIILPGNGANVGTVFYYNGKIEAYQRTYVLHKIQAHPKFIYFHLLYLWKERTAKKQFGSATNYIRMSNFEEYSLPLPPISEQQYLSQKLTALLDEVAQTKQRLEAIPALLKQFRQSVLADAVSGRLTEAWRNTKGIKKNWKYEKAQNICDKVQSGSTPRGNPFDKNGTIPFLKVYNIVNQAINFDYKPQFITIDDHSKRSTALPNDILMNIVGPPLGKIAILTEQYPEWNINQAITLFRVNKEILNYKYLYFLLCEGSFIREIEHNLKGSVGQVNISLSQCRDMIIPTPPLEEQTQIVQKVETYFALADEIETQVNVALENVNLLTQSILAKAFSGELSAAWRAKNG